MPRTLALLAASLDILRWLRRDSKRPATFDDLRGGAWLFAEDNSVWWQGRCVDGFPHGQVTRFPNEHAGFRLSAIRLSGASSVSGALEGGGPAGFGTVHLQSALVPSRRRAGELVAARLASRERSVAKGWNGLPLILELQFLTSCPITRYRYRGASRGPSHTK